MGFYRSRMHLPLTNLKNYILPLRQKEGRIFSEKEIAELPLVAASHPHYKEWLIRKRSCSKLLQVYKTHMDIFAIFWK